MSKSFRLAIDPGHGGRDPGVTAGAVREKDLNLRLAAQLFLKAIEQGLAPFLLRAGDYTLQLEERVDLAENYGADLFLSVHHNGAEDREASGSETYHYPGSMKGERYARAVQAAMTAALGTVDRGVKTAADFYVLRRTAMPAILIEPLFVTGERDRLIYGAPTYGEKLAEAIIDAVLETVLALGGRS